LSVVHIEGSPSRPGPEAEMVLKFIQTSIENPNDQIARTVFIEPPLGAVKPDIVIVDWDPLVTSFWPQERHYLKVADLRLAQLLFLEGPLTEKNIKTYFPRGTASTFSRLEGARIIELEDQRWKLCDLSMIFAVRRIAALEAKISALSRALEQAYFNTWFASESYVLASAKRSLNPFIQKAQYYGIGFWPFSEEPCLEPLLLSKQYELPQSYASWLFNELVWKTSLGKDNER